MKQIYADFNNFDEHGDMPLDCVGSIASIAALESPLREGEEVWLSDGELRTRARVFLFEARIWIARSEEWKFIDGPP